MIAFTRNELYQPGQSFLHKLDPRLKILSCLLLVMLAFSATAWAQLLTLAVSVLLAVRLIAPFARPVWRFCWMLRWLLLFSLLMHLFFSPGRTLLGVDWLSLDGLLSGSRVCAQMLLAVMLSALLAITTPAETLAKTFGWFVRPLHWLGCRTDEWQQVLLLSLKFIPVVEEELRASGRADIGERADSAQAGRQGLWSAWMERMQDFLLRLVNRADAIASSVAAHEEPSQPSPGLSPLMPLSLPDQLFCLALALVTAGYWLVG